MRKNQIDAILIEQTKRRNTILSFVCTIIVISILSFCLFLLYVNSSKKVYITYDEKSDIDYKVNLKENDFFEKDFLESDKQYIASLIENITADFKYNLSFDSNDVEYKYEYRIEANVNVYDENTNNVIFNKSEILIQEQEHSSNEKEIEIKESVEINYDHFNNLINKFLYIYDLDDVESVLTIDMYINTIGYCEEFRNNQENESVISLTIPLTTKTIAIEISNDLIDTENNILVCEEIKSNFLMLLFGIISLIIDIFIIIFLVKYEIKTRTADTIYLKKFKKILNNYGCYIQEISDEFNLKGYQLVKIKSFEDLLEIRDTIKQPILMKQNNEKNSTYFIVPSVSKYLYIYRLNINDIQS